MNGKIKKQVNIAVVDDGINENRYKTGKLIHNIEITRDLQIEPRQGYDTFAPSHGTTCAAIIKKAVPDALLSSVKILSDINRKGIRAQLVKAIEWCADNNINLINLSAGTIDYRDFEEIKDCVRRAEEKGLVIVAACNNRNIYTCPASLANVIGVKCDRESGLDEGEFIYNTFAPDGIEISACSAHKLTDHNGKEHITSKCNSFSAPAITAEVYKIITGKKAANVNEINNELQKRAKECELGKQSLSNNCGSDMDIDVPLVMLLDFHTGDALSIAGSLVRLFRNDGYNAVYTCDEKLLKDKGPGLVPLNTICRESLVDKSSLKTLYRIFDPDIIFSCIDIDNSEKAGLIQERIGIEPDIAIFCSNDIIDENNLPAWESYNISIGYGQFQYQDLKIVSMKYNKKTYQIKEIYSKIRHCME